MDAFRINVFISLTSWPSSVLSSKYLADDDKYDASATYLPHSSKDIHGTVFLHNFNRTDKSIRVYFYRSDRLYVTRKLHERVGIYLCRIIRVPLIFIFI